MQYILFLVIYAFTKVLSVLRTAKKKGLNCNIELVPKSRLNASCSFGSALIKMGRGGRGNGDARGCGEVPATVPAMSTWRNEVDGLITCKLQAS